MRNVMFLLGAWAVVGIGVSCQHQGASSHSESVVAAATTQPAATRSSGLVLRATPEWLFILSLQQEYMTKEGPAHRGAAFAKLAMALNALMVPGVRVGRQSIKRKPKEAISELEVFAVLGPPEFWDSMPTGSAMI